MTSLSLARTISSQRCHAKDVTLELRGQQWGCVRRRTKQGLTVAAIYIYRRASRRRRLCPISMRLSACISVADTYAFVRQGLTVAAMARTCLKQKRNVL